MSDPRQPVCQDEQQRIADLLAHPSLNGIDYLEVDALDHRQLQVFFVKPLAPDDPGNPGDPADALGITANLERIRISGGVRIAGIRVTAAERLADGHLHVTVSEGGDYSTYRLAIDVPGLEPIRSSIEFSFMASCPVDFDCRQPLVCPPERGPEPALDYLAKDYASFARLMLDLVPALNPQFIERNPSDLGIALVELLAHTGDHLSYFQDAVANEAYLETVRQRISARRHARLVDYRMHDGRNAATWVFVGVSAPVALPQATRFVTRLSAPLSGTPEPPGIQVDAASITAERLQTDPALAQALVFESMHPASFDPRNNEMRIHAWGNEQCCLPAGTREAFLFHVDAAGQAVRPILNKGGDLLLEEVKGPLTGLSADADPARRAVVRIDEEPEQTEDPLYNNQLVAGALQRRQAGDPPLPLLRVRWRQEDATALVFCLSSRPPGRELIPDVTVARGNLVLADHGITLSETYTFSEPVAAGKPFRLRLGHAPLTLQCEPETVRYDALTARLLTARTDASCGPDAARPAVALLATFPTGTELWTSAPDLLDSPPFAQEFVAEVDDAGTAQLRFGDGEYGRELAGATAAQAVYRIGSGAAGNAGAGAIAHVAVPGGALPVVEIRNPLGASGGEDAESIEHVRRQAPQAFRAVQFRAVTEADYATAALRLPDVAGAVATFRWTGSWHTVFVAVDPRNPEDLIRRPKGFAVLSPRLEKTVRDFLSRYRLAGYDLEIRPPHFVPLELDLLVCVAPDHFRFDVAKAVTDALSARRLAGGATGFFHPDNFTFGQSVYLSRIYAAVERVQGVESVEVRTFLRAGQIENGELAAGVMTIGPWEIAQLDNDPDFPENGVLRVEARGGKG